MKTEKQIKEQADTIAACMKMPISRNCDCRRKLVYTPSSMKCRKCILSQRIMCSLLNSGLERALKNNDLEKAINILSEVN